MGIERILASSERDFVAKSVDYIEAPKRDSSMHGTGDPAAGVHRQASEPGSQCPDLGCERAFGKFANSLHWPALTQTNFVLGLSASNGRVRRARPSHNYVSVIVTAAC